MSDQYIRIREQPREVLEDIAKSMNVRASEPAMQTICARYMRQITLPERARILEVGCGNGAATKLIMEHLPPDVDPLTAFGAAIEFGRKAAEEEGCGYPPNLTAEAMFKAGTDWHVFPNCVTLPYFDGAVWYRARPDGDDPNKCIFNIWSLKRYAEGKEPKVVTEVHKDITGKSFGLIVDQDVANMEKVQRGMKSRGFSYARPNPVQEVEIINFHRTLEQYVLGQARG